MKKSKAILKAISFLSLISCLSYTTIHAASFQSFEQSAATMGSANSGTAVTDDASIQYYNPAGMAFFTDPALALSGIGVIASINFEPTVATNLRGQPVAGDPNGPSDTSFVPAFYYIQPINDRFSVGFGTEVPFGLTTTYDTQSVARYFATRSFVETINLNPSVAAKITKNFSVGLGFDALYIRAKLHQAFDLGSFIGTLPDNPSFIEDALIRNTAHAWGYGWNAGLFYNYSPYTQFGIGYHSRIKVSPSGRSQVSDLGSTDIDTGLGFNNSPIGTVANFFGLHDSHVSTSVTLPDYATFSVAHDLTPVWKILFDAEYIHWSTVKKLILTFTGNTGPANVSNLAIRNLPPATLVLDYHDTMRFALGSRFQITPRWLIRTGVAFDQSPVPNVRREVRIPDNDRYWLSIGTNFKFTKRFNVDLGYSYIFIKASSIFLNSNPAPDFTQMLAGNYSGHANLFGVQLNYEFS